MEYLVNGVKYATIEEAQEAEKKLEAEKAKKETALAEKKADLAKINTTANDYLKLVKENDKKRAELRKAEQAAYEAYRKELDDFAEKYQGYHLTYRRDGDNVEFQIEEVKQKTLEDCLNEKEENRRSFRNFWNQFWS
jgi:chromosome segregation ATPase